MALDHVEQTLRRGDRKPEEKIKGKTKQFITGILLLLFSSATLKRPVILNILLELGCATELGTMFTVLAIMK